MSAVLDEPAARFSPCRTWRYTLTRVTGATMKTRTVPPTRLGLTTVAFVGLNPSVADEIQDDPTVRRCLGFARRWGYERLVMLNVFALRATDPSELRRVPLADAVGPEADHWIAVECACADLVVCCWGVHAKLGRRGEYVADALRGINVPLHVFALTKEGHPKHPLYLRRGLDPQPWEGYA